jgi:hypothetical protein
MSKFTQYGNDFEFTVEQDVVVMYVNGHRTDEEYLGNATCDMDNIAAVETALFERNRNRYNEVICPGCGSRRKVSGSFGWWIYSTGKWCCDCGENGQAWYSGDEISSLSVCYSGDE